MRRSPFNDGWMVRSVGTRRLRLGDGASRWEAITLPHDAMIGTERSADADAANAYFQGGVWEYRRTLDVPTQDGTGHVALEFEGVYRDALVFVNGVVAGHHPYGYSTFLVPISPLLRVGERNEIRVEAQAGGDSRWYSGAGIYRNVWLLTAPSTHFVPGRLQIRTPQIDREGAVIEVVAAVACDPSSTPCLTLRVEILSASGDVIAAKQAPLTTLAGETVVARHRLYAVRPELWGPDSPYLYECRATLWDGEDVIDDERSMFGVRSISADPDRGLRVNGRPVVLRGACVHHDNGVLGAATLDRAEERRVQLLKAAGFNAIRSAHNHMSRAMLDACDRAGMLVMDEAFDMWLQPKSTDDYALRFGDWWEADVEAMVTEDFNHPSVLLYSIGNEISEGSTSAGLRMGRTLAERVRELDNTRFITQAVNGMLAGGPELVAEFRKEFFLANGPDAEINAAMTNLFDKLSQMMTSDVVTASIAETVSYLDVAGYNYMTSRFHAEGGVFPHQVIVASETYPSTMAAGWASVMEHRYVIGDFTWTGWDYLGEVGIGRIEYATDGSLPPSRSFMGRYPWLSAWCGDIDITGHRRPQSYYREFVFGLRSDPYIAVRRPENLGKEVVYSSPWSWADVESTWTWECIEGTTMVVEVYADADEVELLLNGRSLRRQAVGAVDPYCARFELAYAPGELEALALRGGNVTGRAALRSAAGTAFLEARVDRPRIRAESSDLAFVAIALVDEAGTLYPTADREVTVSVDGPAVLQGLGSANPKSEEPFTGTACTTFRGRCLAVVRPTGHGRVVLTAAAEGCEDQQVIIHCDLPHARPSSLEV